MAQYFIATSTVNNFSRRLQDIQFAHSHT